MSEIEKQFFDTFGIEVRQTCGRKSTCNNYVNYNDCDGCNAYKYPQITDGILLELICMLSKWRVYLDSKYTIKSHNISSLKEDILNDCLGMYNWYEFKKCGKGIKHQVQALFKED